MAEYFAGIGLARLGYEAAGWRVVFANDIDASKHDMHRGHFGHDPSYLLADVHNVAEQPQSVPPTTLAHASFPCTDLSIAGAQRGIHSGQSSAYWGFHRVLEAQGDDRPRFVLLENVMGFLKSNDGSDLDAVLASLNQLGYSVDLFAIDAAHFVPHSRPRLFITGVRGGSVPAVGDAMVESLHRPAPIIDAIRSRPSINWRVRDLPELPVYGSADLAPLIDRLRAGDAQWWSQERAEYLLNQMSDRHREVADQMIGGRNWSFGTVFRRVRNGKNMAELRTDGIAGCLRTPKGGSGRQILFQAGKGEYRVRLLNGDECARLMGVDGYRVSVPLNQALYGFGDGVCASVIEWITTHYFDAILAEHEPGHAARVRVG